MTIDTNKSTLSSHWSSFRLIWWIITILLLLALLISWLLGYGPNGKSCQVPTTVEKRIITPDTTAPLISLNGSSVLHLLIGDKYKEAGARAIDDINGKLNIKISGAVDTSIAGEYTVIYTVSDAAGNTTKKTRRIIVSATPDNEPPVIKLNKDDVITLQTGEHYIDEGAIAIDNIDGDIEVISKGDVNPQKAGEYSINYTAIDKAGNKSTASRKIIIIDPDKSAPIISLNGESIVNVNIGEAYQDAGARAIDRHDGDLQVTKNGTVDTKTAGEYIVSYSATDLAGNKAIKKRKVIVVEEKAKVVQINIFENIYFNVGSNSLPHNVDITLASIVIAMYNDKQTKVSITGSYDNTGSPTSNKTLAMQRAKKLRNTLVTLGIPIERTQIKQPLKIADSGAFKNANSVEVRVTK